MDQQRLGAMRARGAALLFLLLAACGPSFGVEEGQGAEETTECTQVKEEHARMCRRYGEEARLCKLIGSERARVCPGGVSLGEAGPMSLTSKVTELLHEGTHKLREAGAPAKKKAAPKAKKAAAKKAAAKKPAAKKKKKESFKKEIKNDMKAPK